MTEAAASSATATAPLLAVEALRAGYGNIEVLHDVSIELASGTLCAIVGANGAGKTTLLMALAGILPTRGGSVHFDGAEITRMASHDRVRRGLVLVPEGRRMLPGMSVEENLQVAAGARGTEGFARIGGLFDRFPILRARRAVPYRPPQRCPRSGRPGGSCGCPAVRRAPPRKRPAARRA